MNECSAEWLAKERLKEVRAFAARQALIRQALADRPSLRVKLGTLLIRCGQWLRGEASEPDVEAKRAAA